MEPLRERIVAGIALFIFYGVLSGVFVTILCHGINTKTLCIWAICSICWLWHPIAVIITDDGFDCSFM